MSTLEDDLRTARLALGWIDARLKEGGMPFAGWAAVVAFGLTGEPDDALDRYKAESDRERASELHDQARAWYHRELPGGMPVDWIIDAHAAGERDLTIPVVAAALSLDRRLHVTAGGHTSDNRKCVLCAEGTSG